MISFEESLIELNKQQECAIQPGLERISTVLSVLGDPHLDLNAIHIAGTNGKGSVASFLSQYLLESGYRVGMYTSPHLRTPRERIQTGPASSLTLIAEQDWVIHFNRVQDAIRQVGVHLSYFEYLTAMAFDYFAHQKLDWVVIECGLGGRWDATNVIAAQCAILTNISLDHQSWLGETEALIFLEKQAIIKTNQCVVSGIEQLDLRKQLKQTCAVQQCELIESTEDQEMIISQNFPLFQKKNIQLALLALKSIFGSLNSDALKKTYANWAWKGRMEWIEPNVCVDGAHNVAAMRALAVEIKQWGGAPTLVLGMLKDKNYQDAIAEILPYVSAVICVEGYSERECSAEQLEKECLKYLPKVTKISISELINMIDGHSNKIIVAGSLHLVGALCSLRAIANNK